MPGLEDRAGAKIRRRQQEQADAGQDRRHGSGSDRKRPPKKPSPIWRPTCCTAGRRGPPRPGISFPADTAWQQEFDAAFPYRRNARPAHGHRSIKHDMHQPRPMDRLLCGDVGFGKTEVAMRAAFKAVDAGYQVAVLVPTTILAEQHLRTFHGADGRVSVHDRRPLAVLHAARSKSEILERPGGRRGRHRHRHASAGPARRHSSHNLGLLIIDEEQRFGVEVKERLKAPAADGRRADDDRHAHPAHAAPVAAGRARYLESGNAAGRSAGGRNARHAVRRQN